MPETAILHIARVASDEFPVPGTTSWNESHGDGMTLLRWVETQLGLPRGEVEEVRRVVAYAAMLAEEEDPSYAASFAIDRWATAAFLLARRDELRLAGWDLQEHPGLPPLVNALARVERHGRLAPGEAERLHSIHAALDEGQRLTAHRVLLADPLTAWPRTWQRLLERLHTEPSSTPEPSAREGSTLRASQELALGRRGGALPPPDDSFRFASARSRLAACQAIAAILAREPERLARTTVLCEDEATATLLDQSLHRLGLPTMGAVQRGPAQPPLQVLPLVLGLCWEPVDPQLLLDFLTLPHGPLPRHARKRLAHALTQQPGYGSAAWEEAWTDLTRPEADPEGRTQRILAEWLRHPRHPRGAPLPTALVAERAGKVARWALARAGGIADEPERAEDESLSEVFTTAASQAKLLRELALIHGTTIEGPQVDRLVEALRETGAVLAHLPRAAGGPRLVRSLAEVTAPCDDLVWLGTGTAEPTPTPWSHRDLSAAHAAGIALDDGALRVKTLREAERRGWAMVRRHVLVLRLPADEERRPHPLWRRLHAALPGIDDGPAAPQSVEDALAQDGAALVPWQPRATEAIVEAPQGVRPAWQVAPDLLVPPVMSSASELMTRLACPLKWTFRYPAGLRVGDTFALPTGVRLLGNLCHDLLARVFGAAPTVPPPDEARAAVARIFDERLPLDAAVLAVPTKAGERLALRRELVEAAGNLAEVLRRGGYRIVGMEATVNGTLMGRPMQGAIDCLVEDQEGVEAVIDFKYAGKKHRDRLESGRAVQLAVYAAARSAEAGRPVGAVAYLVLNQARILTPAGSPVHGVPAEDRLRGAPGIEATWQRFEAATQAAEDWLASGRIPARPLLPADERPMGSSMVIESDSDPPGEPCRYCDYPVLCGREARL